MPPVVPFSVLPHLQRRLVALVCAVCAMACVGAAAGMQGPLRIHPSNARYFTDDSGRALLLGGAHTWNNLVDMTDAAAAVRPNSRRRLRRAMRCFTSASRAERRSAAARTERACRASPRWESCPREEQHHD